MTGIEGDLYLVSSGTMTKDGQKYQRNRKGAVSPDCGIIGSMVINTGDSVVRTMTAVSIWRREGQVRRDTLSGVQH